MTTRIMRSEAVRKGEWLMLPLSSSALAGAAVDAGRGQAGAGERSGPAGGGGERSGSGRSGGGWGGRRDRGSGAREDGAAVSRPQPARSPGPLKPDASPHDVRRWLLESAEFPEKWVNRLFSVGGLKLQDGKLLLQAFPDYPLDAHPLAALALEPAAGAEPGVLFEDDWCLVLYKPAGMAVHPSRPGHRGTLDEAAVRHCLATGQRVHVRHIHRLDDDTSGPVLYAKNDLAQWLLDEAMRDKKIGRRYAALVHGVPKPPVGVIDAPLGADRNGKGRRCVTPGGDRAVTRYAVAERYAGSSLVRAELETGRTHQIRVHFSHIGHPLVGDALYGRRDERLRHQALHGETLSFRHPWSGGTVEAQAPWPAWFAEARERLAAVRRN